MTPSYHPIVTGTPGEILGEIYLMKHVLETGFFPDGSIPATLNRETIGLRYDALIAKLKDEPRPLFAPKGQP